MTTPRVVHSVACLDAETGGTAVAVPALLRSLEAAATPVALVTRRLRTGEPMPALPRRVAFTPRGRWTGTGEFERSLEREARDLGATLLHDHGIWLPTNHASARTAKRLALPRVVTPHGMLDPWALRWHRGRKRVAWRFYQHRDLRGAAMFHATSMAEARAIRALGFGQPIATIPNGVDVPEAPPTRTPRSPRVALFLSRLHPKKGLPDLVEAWARVRPIDWELRVVGPDEGGHEAALRAQVERSGVGASVRFPGPLYGEARESAFAQADLFVLPTRSENFGLVVAEALARAIPVLTTTAAPWQSIVRERCGWWVVPTSEGLADGLRAATAASSAALEAMGLRGYEFVSREFAWSGIGRRMRAAYDALLSGGRCPDVYVQPELPTEDA